MANADNDNTFNSPVVSADGSLAGRDVVPSSPRRRHTPVGVPAAVAPPVVAPWVRPAAAPSVVSLTTDEGIAYGWIVIG